MWEPDLWWEGGGVVGGGDYKEHPKDPKGESCIDADLISSLLFSPFLLPEMLTPSPT